MKSTLITTACALVAPGILGFTLSTPAHAQVRTQDDKDTKRQQRSDDQRTPDREMRKRDQKRQQDSQARLEPLGWVRVATDYDDDGQYDHIDWIYYYDLKTAQQRSRQRRQHSQVQDAQQSRQQQRQRQQVRVRGEIQDMRTITMSDGDKAVIATIETNDGDRQRVCLSPKDRLSRLDLQQGDRLTVEGHRARLNDRRVVMADRVSANGEQVQLPQRESLSRVRGEIVSKRTTSFRGRDGDYVVARIRTDEGRTRTVNLGQKNRLGKLDLQQGDRVTVLGRSGRMNGQPAIIARQVRANEQTVQVGQARQGDRTRR